VEVERQREAASGERREPDEHEHRSGCKPGPRDRTRDERDAEAHRQADEREQPDEAEGDETADEQPLQDPRRRTRKAILVDAEVEREEGGEEREAARVDDREPSGDERDRHGNGVHPLPDILTPRTLGENANTY